MYESAGTKPQDKGTADDGILQITFHLSCYRGRRPDRLALLIVPFLVAFQQPDPGKAVRL